MVEEEFEPGTMQAFRRLALDGISGAEAAQELGMSVAAVYVAKSRVSSDPSGGGRAHRLTAVGLACLARVRRVV